MKTGIGKVPSCSRGVLLLDIRRRRTPGTLAARRLCGQTTVGALRCASRDSVGPGATGHRASFGGLGPLRRRVPSSLDLGSFLPDAEKVVFSVLGRIPRQRWFWKSRLRAGTLMAEPCLVRGFSFLALTSLNWMDRRMPQSIGETSNVKFSVGKLQNLTFPMRNSISCYAWGRWSMCLPTNRLERCQKCTGHFGLVV